MVCGADHPHYRRAATCDRELGHVDRHHAYVNLTATGGWVGDMEWDEHGNVWYEGHPNPERRLDLSGGGDRFLLPETRRR